MHDIAVDGVEVAFSDRGQDWRVAWHPPPDPPEGMPHGAQAICRAGDDVVLIGTDGQLWGLPGGRPEPGETLADTLRREVWEEACATVTAERLLGFTAARCVRGREQGVVLVRSMWLADVVVHPWRPEFEISHRRLVPASEAFAAMYVPPGLAPSFRRMFVEAGLAA